MGSVEVLRDRRNLAHAPHVQLFHVTRAASPVQIKKKLRRLNSVPESKENLAGRSSISSSSSVSSTSTLSRPILKRKYLPSMRDASKHVHFLSDVTVFQMRQDGSHVITKSEALNTEPKSRDTLTRRALQRAETPGVEVWGERGDGSLDRTGSVRIGASLSSVSTGQAGQKNNNYGVTVTTPTVSSAAKNVNIISHTQQASLPNLHSNSLSNNQSATIQSNHPSVQNNSHHSHTSSTLQPHHNSYPTTQNYVTHNPNLTNQNNPNLNHHSTTQTISHNNPTTITTTQPSSHPPPPQPKHSSISQSTSTTAPSTNKSSNELGQMNISFVPDPVQGTKLKFCVNIGQGYDPDDIVVKANMNGSRIRVMATRMNGRDRQEFNERFVLPMDIDPFTVDARLDGRGMLTVEAPLMTLERRQNKSDNSNSAVNNTLV